MVELLSPAGSYEGFIAAMMAGADAVYAGGERFGARAYARNFTDEELLGAIDTAHLLGKKLYLTVNILCKEDELRDLQSWLAPFYRQGLDGVIVQDAGAVVMIKKLFPDLPVHASTQMCITGTEGCRYAKSLGMSRVVPARELGLDEIRQIRSECDIELECFIHGAMCYSYSGMCLFSGYLGGRSGNRGRCAQPCRLEYGVKTDDGIISRQDQGCILSMRDMCTISILPELIDAGISSFKIEGRMKKPEYTWFATSMYRKYIDMYVSGGKYEVSKEDMRALAQNYMRTSLGKGYYHIYNGPEMITLSRPGYSEHSAVIPSGPLKGAPVRGRGEFIPEKEARLSLESDGVRVTVTGSVCQIPQKKPMSQDEILRRLSKTGDEEFYFEKLEIDMPGDIFLPVSGINELRRSGFRALKEAMLGKYRREDSDETAVTASTTEVDEAAVTASATDADGPDVLASVMDADGPDVLASTEDVGVAAATGYTVLCESLPQLDTTLEYAGELKRIYLDSAAACEDRYRTARLLEELGGRLFIALPVILRSKDIPFVKELTESFPGAGFLARNYEELNLLRNTRCSFAVDHSLYTFNSQACRLFLAEGAKSLTCPLELDSHRLMDRGFMDRSELVVYGRAPMMVSAQCPFKTLGRCRKDPREAAVLTDRYNKELPLIRSCRFCYTRIMNAVPTLIYRDDKRLGSLAPALKRIDFSVEDAAECRAVLDYYLRGEKLPDIETTRGHFHRSVE